MEWFSVRHVIRHRDTFEERITLWRSETAEDAIERATAEAAEYISAWDDEIEVEVLDLFQSFHLFDAPAHGREVFSLIRDSQLGPKRYIDTFFDTGAEHQRTLPAE